MLARQILNQLSHPPNSGTSFFYGVDSPNLTGNSCTLWIVSYQGSPSGETETLQATLGYNENVQIWAAIQKFTLFGSEASLFVLALITHQFINSIQPTAQRRFGLSLSRALVDGEFVWVPVTSEEEEGGRQRYGCWCQQLTSGHTLSTTVLCTLCALHRVSVRAAP